VIATATKKVTDPVQEFDKGAKRDTTAFPSLKDERNWDQFLRVWGSHEESEKMRAIVFFETLSSLYITEHHKHRMRRNLFQQHIIIHRH
jgi:hypothetical protein